MSRTRTATTGLTLLAIWKDGELVLPQPDLFRGWQPYSGRFPKSAIVDATGLWIPDSISESPSEGEGYSACSLAQTLETLEDWLSRHPGATSQDWWDYLRKYFLSATAASGILRRARKRGRKLPPLLEQALEEIAGSLPPDGEEEADSPE